MLTVTATGVGVEGCVALASGSGGVVELSDTFPETNEDSCMEIWASSWTEGSVEGGCSHVYDSTVKAVTTAEKRPV